MDAHSYCRIKHTYPCYHIQKEIRLTYEAGTTMSKMEITMAQRYIATLCIHYFDDLMSQLPLNKSSFIIDEWYETVFAENETKPCISVDMFMKKYKLRLKLVRP